MKRSLPRLALAAVGILAPACGEKPRDASVLLISIDTLRQDHVSAYGYPRPTTPALDRLAAGGAIFESAWSPTSWTLPAHVSALTGLAPSAHQVEEQRDRLPEGVPTLAEAFRASGYATAGFVSHDYLDADYGFARGFERYELRPLQRAEEVTAQALTWLGEHDREPFFLFLHYFDPHADYEPPESSARLFDPEYAGHAEGRYTFLRRFEDPAVPLPPEVERRILALYDGEIRYTDDQIGRVVEFLAGRGRLDDTVVAVFSDHGEEFKEHGSLGHGGTLYSEVTRVPLILRFPPRVSAGRRVASPALLTDLPVLLTALAGIPPDAAALGAPAEVEGVLAEVTGRGPAVLARELLFETTRDGPKRFARLAGGFAYVSPSKYVRLEPHASGDASTGLPVQHWIAVPEGLFRLPEDPFERLNLLDRAATTPEIDAAVSEGRAAVARYVRGEARGVRLVCGGTGPDGAGRFEGTVRFEKAVLDEPFGYNLSAGDRVMALGDTTLRLTSDHYGIELRVDRDEKGVVFLPPAGVRRVFVALLRNGSSCFSGVATTPEAGATLALGPAAACRLEGGARGPAGGKGEVSLTPEQLERLKSLGYVQ